MAIGINWADIWGPVWDPVWATSTPEPEPEQGGAADDDGGRPGWVFDGYRSFDKQTKEAAPVRKKKRVAEPREVVSAAAKQAAARRDTNSAVALLPSITSPGLNPVFNEAEALRIRAQIQTIAASADLLREEEEVLSLALALVL